MFPLYWIILPDEGKFLFDKRESKVKVISPWTYWNEGVKGLKISNVDNLKEKAFKIIDSELTLKLAWISTMNC